MLSDDEKMQLGRDLFDASQPTEESRWKARAKKAEARVAELEALMHFDARRPDGRGVGPDDIKAYLDQTEWEWLTVVQQVRGRLMAFEDFQKRAEQAEAEAGRLRSALTTVGFSESVSAADLRDVARLALEPVE